MHNRTNTSGGSSDSKVTRSYGALSAWRDRKAVREALAGELLSLANLVGRPVVDSTGNRVARVSDVVVRWESGTAHPPVTEVLVRVGKGLATLSPAEVTLTQAMAQVRRPQLTAALPARREGDVALARDVLDHQLIDVNGVQVVRAADVYLARGPSSWELAGIDVGGWALLRRLFPKRRVCPPPDRALDWVDLQAFVPRFADETPPVATGPAGAAGLSGSSMQTASPAASLHRLRAQDVARLLAGLDRDGKVQLVQLADSSTATQALADLEPAKRNAILAELDEADRAKLEGQLSTGSR